MAKIQFYKANGLPASPTSADDGIWFIADGANNYKHFVITSGVVKELTVTGAGGGSAEWGQITGTLADQSDLQIALSSKADDNTVVHNTKNETIAGTKTFSTSPRVPSKSTAAGNNPTSIATESQVYLKANDADVVKLTGNQTVAGTKTFSTNVPIPLTPTANAHATSKKYVDDADANLQNQINNLVLAIDAGLKTPEPIDCSSNPNYPAAERGDTYKVTVVGKIGGALGEDVEVGDLIICTANNAGGTQAQVGQHFFIVQTNINQATENVPGFAKVATQTKVDDGTDDKDFVTSKKLQKKIDDEFAAADGKYVKEVKVEGNNLPKTNGEVEIPIFSGAGAGNSNIGLVPPAPGSGFYHMSRSGNWVSAMTQTHLDDNNATPRLISADLLNAQIDAKVAAAALEWTTEDW